jgi:hypothetical protein
VQEGWARRCGEVVGQTAASGAAAGAEVHEVVGQGPWELLLLLLLAAACLLQPPH